MTFPMPVLVNVLSARYTATGAIDLELVVTNHCGNPEPETIWYTRDVNEEWLPDGRLYELGLEIDAWFFAHPEFEVAEYVPPVFGPADFPLPARQLRLGLIRLGIGLSAVQAAINSIPDQTDRDESQVYWEFSTVINWSHPMTQGLMALAGIDQKNAVEMWRVAKNYER